MQKDPSIKLIECPRDAMQGWPHFIPTQKKIDYINHLLQVGFDTIDFGSFVSPKAIPQMADTDRIYAAIQAKRLKLGRARAWSLVPNRRGLERVARDDLQLRSWLEPDDGVCRSRLLC